MGATESSPSKKGSSQSVSAAAAAVVTVADVKSAKSARFKQLIHVARYVSETGEPVVCGLKDSAFPFEANTTGVAITESLETWTDLDTGETLSLAMVIYSHTAAADRMAAVKNSVMANGPEMYRVLDAKSKTVARIWQTPHRFTAEVGIQGDQTTITLVNCRALTTQSLLEMISKATGRKWKRPEDKQYELQVFLG